jgi:hypothetical protein
MSLAGNESGTRKDRRDFSFQDRDRILRLACVEWEDAAWFKEEPKTKG